MRIRSLLAAVVPLALASCNLNTVGEPGPLIDCSTLAADLAGQAATLTTTASGLQYRDVTVGTGATFASGAAVSVRYSGCVTSGLRFDSNEAPLPVFSFLLGQKQVIPGWDEGLVGMKVGGRRQLVIPPALGYGAVQNGPIPPNSTLVFTIDAISTP